MFRTSLLAYLGAIVALGSFAASSANAAIFSGPLPGATPGLSLRGSSRNLSANGSNAAGQKGNVYVIVLRTKNPVTRQSNGGGAGGKVVTKAALRSRTAPFANRSNAGSSSKARQNVARRALTKPAKPATTGGSTNRDTARQTPAPPPKSKPQTAGVISHTDFPSPPPARPPTSGIFLTNPSPLPVHSLPLPTPQDVSTGIILTNSFVGVAMPTPTLAAAFAGPEAESSAAPEVLTNPEPSSQLVWGVLIGLVALAWRRGGLARRSAKRCDSIASPMMVGRQPYCGIRSKHSRRSSPRR